MGPRMREGHFPILFERQIDQDKLTYRAFLDFVAERSESGSVPQRKTHWHSQ